MPNPYAVEYGRFSSGLVVIQTRRGGDTWRMRLSNLTPTLRNERHKDLYTVTGVSGFAPNFSVGGPIVKQRLFLEQTVQYRYSNDDIVSRPEDERRTTHWLSSFTRVDANLSPKHSLIGTGGFFPSVTNYASLGTFTPPDATVDLHDRVAHATISERALWNDRLISETTMQVRGYRGEVTPQGSAPMELYPDTTLGNFFNHQTRTPQTFQVIQTVSGTAKGPAGLHVYKFGADILSNQYDGQERQPSIPDPPAQRDAGASIGFQRADRPDVANHRRGDVRAGSGAAFAALVRGIRRPPRSRWHRRTLEYHAPRRRRRAAERVGQFGAARRLWSVLRTDAVGGWRFRSV